MISLTLYPFLFVFSKLHAQFLSMEVRNSSFAAYIDAFTSNTYAMVVMSDTDIRKLFIIGFYYLQYLIVISWYRV